jgi:hypothetical protein
MDINTLKSDLTNPESKTFKIVVGVIALLLVSYLIFRYKKKRNAYLKKNPVFFKKGTDPKVKQTIDADKFYKSESGNELTFFFWMYVDNMVYKYGQWKDVFIKGRPGSRTGQCPSVWINKKKNALRFEVSTTGGIDVITLDDFPIRKWFSSAIVLRGTECSIYRDGLLVLSKNLKGTLRQNTGKLFIGRYGGYGGQLSCLHYFSKAIDTNLIQYKHSQGPFCMPFWEKIYDKLTGFTSKLAGSIKLDISIDLDIPKYSSESGACNGKYLKSIGKTTDEKAKDMCNKNKSCTCIQKGTKGSNKGKYFLYKNRTGAGKRTYKNSSYTSILKARDIDKKNKKAKKKK